MKKVLLLAAVALNTQVSAQIFESDFFVDKEIVDFRQKMNSNKGGSIDGYLDYNDLILNDFGASAVADDGFVTITPDSAVLVYYSNDTVWSSYHGFGAIYDATCGYFSNAFAPNDVITLDTIYWAGWYDIYDASANDSMKISLKKISHSDLKVGIWPSGYWSYLGSSDQPITNDIAYTGSSSNGVAGGIDNADITFTIPMSNFQDGFNVFEAVVPNGFSWNAEDALGIVFEYIPERSNASDTMFLVDDTATFNPYFQYFRVDPWDGSQYTGMFVQIYDSTVTTTSTYIRKDERYVLNSGNDAWRNERTSNQPWISNEVWLKVSGTSTFVVSEGSLSSMKIWPNPSNGLVNVELNANANATVTVVDILGQVVYRSNENFVAGNRKTIDLSTQAKGMYLLSVEGEGINVVERISIK